MSSSLRTNNTLREQMKALKNKTESEQAAWLEGLNEQEMKFVETQMKTTKGIKLAQATAASSSETSEEPKGPAVESLPTEITEARIAAMWSEIDNFDVSSLDQESLKIFEYQGFNPKAILISLMKSCDKNKIPKEQFKSDIITLCAISIIKGSINSNNIKKVSEEGQQEISRLETLYNIKRGGGRKERPDVITVSRIGATFPGKIVQLIHAGKVQSRAFMGPFSSSSLPPVMRHQAFAAVIPRSMNHKIKEFLLQLITAFSVDQSISINPNKREKMDPVTTFSTQHNYIQVIHNGEYPPENIKIQIFKTISINFDDLLVTARKIVALTGNLEIPSKDEFNSAVMSFN
nr:coat protein [Watermelon crinkle leaf-associated virus 2]